MSGHAYALAMAALDVNGPADAPSDWNAIPWRHHEDNVRRLRQRIFKATRAQDYKTVRNLQRMMLRSWSNTLVSVRQVTQRNAGRYTAGVDGKVALTSPTRMRLAEELHRHAQPWKPRPVKRVYIPKANGKLRGLGIPVIADRAQQARVRNALEPEWEARFEPRSYGFRPGRSCHDAIAMIFTTLRGRKARRLWILDADLAGAFDRIDHDQLLANIGLFPARDMIRRWLKAGVIEKGRFTPTGDGAPQGGVISPLLMNVALHGMEPAAGIRYRRCGDNTAETERESPALVRYADDYVALCHSREHAENLRQQLSTWLAQRGLAHNTDKTQITPATTGFDFLGCTIRRYPCGKLLIKPSKTAVTRIKRRLAEEVRSLRGAAPGVIIGRLNPIITGWAAYYRGVVSTQTFHTLDHYLWRLTYRWALRRHPNKPRTWVKARYFGLFHPSRQDRWIFGDRTSGAYLRRFSWTKIVRHQMVTGTASPDDPALTHYWATRRRKQPPPPLDRSTLRLLKAQDGRCPSCGDCLLHADQQPQSPHEWEQWLRATRKAITKHWIGYTEQRGTPDSNGNWLQLVHTHCQRRSPPTATPQHPTQIARTPSGLA
jgi:RNA-directed DNA polymerase